MTGASLGKRDRADEPHDRLPDVDVEVPPHPQRRDGKPEIHSIIRLLANIP